MRKARLQMSIRDLIIAIAIVGLLLGHLADLFRTRSGRTRVTIRVFNKTSEDVGFLRYEWDTVARHVESHGENSGRVVIAPGGVKSFRSFRARITWLTRPGKGGFPVTAW